MQAFLAVLHDLVIFIGEAVQTIIRRERQERTPASPKVAALESAQRDGGAVFHKDLPATPVVAETAFSGQTNAFVIHKDALVFSRPVWAFDTVCAKLPIATEVVIDSYEGRFARIHTTNTVGWILKDDISNRREDVWPRLTDTMVYEALDQVTQQVRMLISDEFFARDLYLPLQPQEFIVYRLAARRLGLPRVDKRPRLVGEWHAMFKGLPGVRITLEAKTGSVMEVVSTTDPFLAFVTAVAVDGSVSIESVGRYREGEYRIETLDQTAWRELRPVFIQF